MGNGVFFSLARCCTQCCHLAFKRLTERLNLTHSRHPGEIAASKLTLFNVSFG